MTEYDWLICNDPRQMLVFLEGRASRRKARLFACGVGRSLRPFLGDEQSHTVIDVAERNADDAATDAELEAAREAAQDAIHGPASRIVMWIGDRHAWQAARVVAFMLERAENESAAQDWNRWITGEAMATLRCVFGDPFRSVTLNTTWLTPDGISLAQSIYDERDFERMPELADALEKAGCQNDAILEHCRGPGPHVRGCWVIDSLLGKS